MKYLISACLAGENVRYDGQNCLNHILKKLVEQHTAIFMCPEIMGGLSIPRLPAEIVGGDGHDVLLGHAQVINAHGQDISSAFIQGAHKTLDYACMHQVTHVILKANSPSCSSNMIYDGSFQGLKILGQGVTAALLTQHGFIVMDEIAFCKQFD